MNASEEPSRQGTGRSWLVLIHQLPPKPDYLRVKVRRRLQGLGAVPLRPSVYLLPDSEEALEDFHWLLQEIRTDGGAAMLCRAEFLAGIGDEEIGALLAAARRADGGNGAAAPDRVEPGRTWVTREGIKVDRMASAWLIRRFLDPDARFRFVPARGYRPRPGELRFDMFEAEYTHEGERCTFQTLAARFGLRDRALAAIGEIVHDIDCRDERFGRPETDGVARLVDGIVASTGSDPERLERGRALFDDLYRALRNRP